MDNRRLKIGYGCGGKRCHISEKNQFWNIIPHYYQLPQQQDQIQGTGPIRFVNKWKRGSHCQLDIWYARMWDMNHIIATQLKVAKLTQT